MKKPSRSAYCAAAGEDPGTSSLRAAQQGQRAGDIGEQGAFDAATNHKAARGRGRPACFRENARKSTHRAWIEGASWAPVSAAQSPGSSQRGHASAPAY